MPVSGVPRTSKMELFVTIAIAAVCSIFDIGRSSGYASDKALSKRTSHGCYIFRKSSGTKKILKITKLPLNELYLFNVNQR